MINMNEFGEMRSIFEEPDAGDEEQIEKFEAKLMRCGFNRQSGKLIPCLFLEFEEGVTGFLCGESDEEKAYIMEECNRAYMERAIGKRMIFELNDNGNYEIDWNSFTASG